MLMSTLRQKKGGGREGKGDKAEELTEMLDFIK
jgi:hypothetical protein